MIDPDVKDLWTPTGLILGFQVVLFEWRLERESEVGDKGSVPWLVPSDYVSVLGMLCFVLGVVLLPVSGLVRGGVARWAFGLGTLLFLGQVLREERMKKAKARNAKIGQRMIEMKLYFWTNKIAKGEGRIIPKHAWGSGMLRIEPNDAHGIRGRKPLAFHSPLEVPFVIERALIEHGIVLHPTRRMQRYTVT